MAAAAKAIGGERGSSSVQVGSANSNVGFDSPTASTAHTNGNGSSAVTHLGVVGRGVKRVLMSSGTAESNPTKKSASHLTDDKGDGKTSWSSGCDEVNTREWWLLQVVNLNISIMEFSKIDVVLVV